MAQKCWPGRLSGWSPTGWEHRILKARGGAGGDSIGWAGGITLALPLQAVLQVPASRVVGEKGKARTGGLPHAPSPGLTAGGTRHAIGGAVKSPTLPGGASGGVRGQEMEGMTEEASEVKVA